MDKTLWQKNKFKFYEIIKIDTNDQEYSEIQDLEGVILGMSQSDEDGEWGYAVQFNDDEGWDVPESIMVKTGKFSSRDKFYSGESIRVSNHNNIGQIEASYNSLYEIKEVINRGDHIKAFGYMIEAAKVCDNIDEIYNLIRLCINHNNNLIRRAGFVGLNQLIARLGKTISHDFIKSSLEIGGNDDDHEIRKMSADILEYFRNIDYDFWYELKFKK